MDGALSVVPICRRAAIPLMGRVVAVGDNFIEKNVLSPVPPVHDIIDRAGILHSQRARHETKLTETRSSVKRQGGG